MTTTPDFRALCAELVKLLQNCPVTADTDWIAERMTLLYSARAALATPLPEPTELTEPPTDEELLAMRSWSSHSHTFDSDLVDFARAVLERWGR